MYFTNNLEQDCLNLFLYIDALPLFTTQNRAKYNDGKRPISNLYGTTNFGIVANKSKVFSRRVKNPEGKGYLTKLKGLYPEYQDIFEEFVKLHYGDFKFNQVIINRDFKITRHIDAKNVGESIIIGLGDYQEGKLVVEFENEIKKIDIKNKFYKFDGSKYYHFVEQFKGNRYSLVFYNQ